MGPSGVLPLKPGGTLKDEDLVWHRVERLQVVETADGKAY